VIENPVDSKRVEEVLEARDVHVTFQSRTGLMSGLLGGDAAGARAVDGVSLKLLRGEVLALAGESGCGKTTLARTMVGLQRPNAGTVVFNGAPIRDLRAYRRKVQIVFQDPTGALNPRQTIYESVAEGLRIHKIPGNEEERVVVGLGRAGLRPAERFFMLYPHELSGGQRQRAVIAGALVLEPEVIIADEPVSMLDASVRGEILRLLLRLRDDLGLSILVVTHDLGLAWTVADRVAVMYLGRIVEDGPAEAVLTQPLHPYTRSLLKAVPQASDPAAPGSQAVLSGEPPDPTRIPGGCRFHPRCPEVASGRAERVGALARCKSEDPALIEAAGGQCAACHLAH
jgi:oligopeptide/dipeptide ABC transporter ATP-binding protein